MRNASWVVYVAAIVCIGVFFLFAPVRGDLSGIESIETGMDTPLTLPSSEDSVFSSSDPLIAAVSLNGVVTPLTPGVTRITRSGKEGLKVYDLTVSGTPVTSLSLGRRELFMSAGKTETLIPEFNPGATDTRVSFLSSDPDVVSVDENGNAFAAGSGKAEITCTARNGLSCILYVTVE